MGRILTSERGQAEAGYFRIGPLILDIPPEQIQCHKVINSNEVLPLRFPFAMPVKSGQSRWDVTWSWKAIQDPTELDPYNAWRDVQTLLAVFKSSPFVEVENEHIRQIVNPSQLTQGATNDDVMAFALRQMRVDTVPDLADTLQVTMTMSLFNYRPYSKNFLYADDTGKPVANALSSSIYQNYLNKWIQNNLNDDPTQQPQNDPAVSDVHWDQQTPGTITFSCREYQAVPLPHTLPPPAGQAAPTSNNPGATTPGTATQGVQSGFVDNVSVTLSGPSDPQIQWWITAASAAEGAGYQVMNTYPDPTTGKTSSAYGILQWVKAAAIDAMKQSDSLLGTRYIATAQQAGFLVTSAAASSGVTWSKALPSGTPLSTDPQTATYWGWMSNPPVSGGSTQLQNNMATAWAYNLITKYNGDILQSWEADRFGPGKIASGQNLTTLDNRWFTVAVNSWRQSSGNAQAFAPTQNNTPIPQPNPPAVTQPLITGTNTNPQPNVSNTNTIPGTVPVTDQIRLLIGSGWTYDYATESAAFLYKEHNLKLTDQQHGDVPSSTDIEIVNANFFAYTNQISVVFVNNIAQLPLSSYQYPTYQHLGPVSTLISVGLLSNAQINPSTDIYPEPEHHALSLLSDLTSMLEDQFQRLRNEWRRVNSIHRMQAVSIKNQVLNMLGIRGVLTKELTTETIPESPNMVTAQYNAVQYENVFEEVDPNPFRVNSVPSQTNATWLTILRDGTLNQFQGDQSLLALTNLSTLMQQANNTPATVVPGSAPAQLLFSWLTSASPNPPSTAYLVPTPYSFTGAQTQLMMSVMDENPGLLLGAEGEVLQGGMSFADTYPDIAKMIQTHSQLNYSDYFLIRNGIDSGIQDYDNFQSMATQIDASIASALAANTSFEPPLNQLYDLYVGYASSNNVLNIASQMVRAVSSPQLSPLFTTPTTTTTPGSQPANADHGCYRDMGIRDVQLGGRDYTPAVYFYDDNKQLTSILQGQISQAVTATATSVQAFALATPYADKSHLISSSTGSFGSANGINGNIQGILQQVKPSAYTMAKAFPTFKLFLMEDNSQKPFYAYDKFYSYASVLDMEIIRYRDRPDTAVIQISNLMHLLDQHLYDSTPQGRFQQKLRANIEPILPGGDALTSGGAVVGAVDTEMWSLDNRFPQINASGNGDQKFPLKYFALQTGTKVQVRMGFSNNPDLLVPVFTGEVTEIEGNEVLKITAQSYMLELTVPSPDDLRHDGFAIDSFINNITNALVKSVRDIGTNIPNIPHDLFSVFGNSPAYGGWGTVGGITIPGIITPGGTAGDVISAMLKVSTAKHFGNWQLGAPTDPYIKGYSWQSVAFSALSLLSQSPLTKGATGLEAGYNRSFENVLTSHIFGPDGTAVADANGGQRTWWFEKPGGYGAPEYFVPKDPTLTPWTLIQDIARRYPEFILAVKQYGFPFTADATLVFANPHDFYSTRPPQPNEVETQQQSSQDNQSFSLWWTSGTQSGKAQFIAYCTGLGAQWANTVLVNYDQSISFKGDSAASKLGQFGDLLSSSAMSDLTATQLAAHIDGGGAPVFFTITKLFTQASSTLTSTILTNVGGANSIGHGVSINQAQQALSQLVQNYYNYLNQLTTGSTTNVALNSRMKPVRRYHLVNGDNIIHNGISLNEKFYNTVRLNNQTLPANDSIPSQYRRTLVADPFIVSPNNLKGDTPITNAYLQSFLRDELAKAYRGEIVLLGNPDIEPFDVLVLVDPSTGISGPVEVDHVIHSFNLEQGYITIVRPRSMVVVNDKLSAPIYQAVLQMLGDMQGVIEGAASKLPFSINSPTAELGLGIAAVAGAVAAGPWIASAAALGAGTLLFWTGKVVNRLNPFGMVPLTRFERPWISGLEGWKIDDVLGTLATKWQYFKVDEIEPLIFSFRTARGMGII